MAEDGTVIAIRSHEDLTDRIGKARSSNQLVDVDELKSVAEEFSVEAMPTFVLVWEGKVKDRVVGAAKDELCEKINNHLATTITTRA